MPRRRIIDPEIWDDEDVGSLSSGAFRLFIACISNADDDGRMAGGAKRLKGLAFRYCDVTIDDVAAWISEIKETVRGFLVYSADGREYIQLINWHKYQSIPKAHYTPSKLPPPPDARHIPFGIGKARVQPESCTGTVLVQDNSRTYAGLAHDDSRTDNGSVYDDSYTDNEPVQDDSFIGDGFIQDEYSTDTVPVQRKERKKESKEKKEEKEIKEAPLTPLKGESAGSDYFRYLALQFRKFFPSPKQGTLDSTIACMRNEYPLYEREEIETRMHEHLSAGSKDLAPWELFSREPGGAFPVKKEPRRRNADELDFFDLHGHFPEQTDKAASCRICAEEGGWTGDEPISRIPP